MRSKDHWGQREGLVFVLLSALYVLSQFYRVSNAVIMPSLISELELDAKQCGLLGGAFFYSFTALQIPLGPMLDQVGPRPILLASVLLAAAGALLFACSQSFASAFWGRLLIGAGMAPVLMGSLKYLSQAVSPSRFAKMTGLLYSIGISGTLLATSPLVFLSQAMGWRRVFTALALLTAGVGILAFKALEGVRARGEPKKGLPWAELARSLYAVFKSLLFWRFAAVAFFRYGTFVSLQGLWLATFLGYAKGFDALTVGNLLLCMSIGAIAGGPIGGYLFSRGTGHHKRAMALPLSLYASALLILAATAKAWEVRSPAFFGLLLFALGLFNGMTMMVYTEAKESFPLTLSGTVMSCVNFFTMAGGGIFMPLLGLVMGRLEASAGLHSPEAYQYAFLVCFGGMLASVLFYMGPIPFPLYKGRRKEAQE